MLRRSSLVPVAAVALALAFAPVLAGPAGAAVPAWTTYRHDAARSGIDPDSSAPVTPAQAWQTPALDGEVYAQPLVYGADVYVATENDTVYALDAATGAVAWSTHLAAPEPSSAAPCGDISPSIGITSTPVIDPAANRIYAVGAVSAAGVVSHELFALDLGSGQPVAGFPIAVDPTFPAGGMAVNQLQRAGLGLDQGRILVGFGGNDGDCQTYWGWLVSAPADGAGALDVFQVDAGHDEGAIWGAGNAPAIDSAGDVFLATGNGAGNPGPDPEYGDSVVKLSATAASLDWWAPTNWQSLDSSDADLGSSMPTLLPGGFVFESGKDGNGYVIDGAALGHVSAPAREAAGFCSGGSLGGSVYDPADATLYAACSAGLRALSVGAGTPPGLAAKAGFSAPSGATGPPMIAGGLVWATNYGSGTLYGLDPASGATRSHLSIPETGTEVNHFASPSAGGGRLFVGSGDQVTAFTVAQQPSPTATSTTLAASLNPVRASAAVTLTATVSPMPDAGAVTFSDGGVAIPACSGVVVSSATGGNAVCHVSFGRVGTHNLVASYAGDAFYAASVSATLAESVAAGASGGRPRPPVISRASISPRRFTAGRAATLRITLDAAATLTVTVTRWRHHRRVTAARLRLHARAGRNAFRIRLRRLAPRGYTALLSASDAAGHRSRTVRITFTILRAPRR
jgi:outer membrane protein assembly factor BamB